MLLSHALYLQLFDTISRESFQNITQPFNDIEMSIPHYLSAVSLQYAKERIKYPPFVLNNNNEHVRQPYEHHAGSWACTMLKSVFSDDEWIITPEMVDRHTSKKPDLVVEQVLHTSSVPSARYHLMMELKSSKGDRFEVGLNQVSSHIAETVENQVDLFIIIQRGTKIGFFEYHNDRTNIDEEGIPHFRGCISLTQDYYAGDHFQRVLEEKPAGLLPLYHDTDNLEGLKDLEGQGVRNEASRYIYDCVFDLDQHEEEINFVLHYILTHQPRPLY